MNRDVGVTKIPKDAMNYLVSYNKVLERAESERDLLQIRRRKKERKTSYVLKLITTGKIEGRLGIGRKKYSCLENIRDWLGLDALSLFIVAQNSQRFLSTSNKETAL